MSATSTGGVAIRNVLEAFVLKEITGNCVCMHEQYIQNGFDVDTRLRIIVVYIYMRARNPLIESRQKFKTHMHTLMHVLQTL